MARDADVILSIFDSFDQDGNGILTKEELTLTLQELDPDLRTAQIDALLSTADLNKDGVVSYREFVTWITEGQVCTKPFEEIRVVHAGVRATRLKGSQVAKLLEFYDPEKSLNEADFVNLWLELEIATEDAKQWFVAVDVNRSGNVSFKELMTALIICSGEGDTDTTAEMLMKVHDANGGGLSKEEFLLAVGQAVGLMKATFYPALKDMLKTELTPEGVTWAEVFTHNQRYDMGASAPASDDAVLELALRDNVYPESTFDAMMSGFSDVFGQVDRDGDGTISLQDLKVGLGQCAELRTIMFPQHTVGAMLASYGRGLS